MEMNFIVLLVIIPLISAFIGWMTNYIAIRSLFRPIKPINVLGFKFWGLIPKRKKAIAKNIAKVIEGYLFNHNDILSKLEKPSNVEKIKRRILPILEEKILDKVPDMFKMIATPIISKVLEKELDSIISAIGKELSNHIFESVNIEDIVKEKIINYDISDLEDMIYKVAKSELKHIEMLGAVIGFIVGCFQVILMILL